MSGDFAIPRRSLPRGTFWPRSAFDCGVRRRDAGLRGCLPGDVLRRRLRRHAAGCSVLAWSSRGDRGDALFGAGVVPRRAAHPAVAGGGRVFPLLNPFARGHGDGQPRRGVLLAGDRAGDDRGGQPERDRLSGLDVLPDLLRSAELRDLRRGHGRTAPPSGRASAFPPRAEPGGALLCVGAMLAIHPLAGGRGAGAARSPSTSTCSAACLHRLAR